MANGRQKLVHFYIDEDCHHELKMAAVELGVPMQRLAQYGIWTVLGMKAPTVEELRKERAEDSK